MRTPVFELHIRPMFRATDRAHMQKFFGDQFDLWDYDVVVERAPHILRRLELDMPTTDTGGPWPPEWILLFNRWIAAGFKRLSLGRGEYSVSRFNDVVELSASGTLPGPGCQAWLQLEAESEVSRTYVLYVEPPDKPEQGAGDDFSAAEQFAVTSERVRLFVRDATGVTELAVPPAQPVSR